MTFDSGPSEPGFSFSGWVGLGGILYPAAPNVNSQSHITKNEGCWSLESFEAYYFLPGGGTWLATSNLGHEHYFTITSTPVPVVLNWENIKTLTLQLVDPGTGIPNNTFDFDNVVYTVPSFVPPETPSVSFDPGPYCPGESIGLNFAGEVNDGFWEVREYYPLGGSFVKCYCVGSFLAVATYETTTYSIQGVTPGGCYDPTPLIEFTIEIESESTPFTGASVDPDPVITCSDQLVTWTATGGTEGTGAVTKWYTEPDGGGVVYGVGNPLTIYISSNLTYYVRREGLCNTTASIPVSVTYEPDPNAPDISCPFDVEVVNTTIPCEPMAVPIGDASALHPCNVTISNNAPEFFPEGSTDVLWTAEQQGIVSQCTQTVTVSCCIQGCMDDTACNYAPGATCEDGSCEFSSCVPCFGDLDGDNTIATSDLLVLLGQFGCISACSADLNGDDEISTADILSILGVFGTSCL